MALDAPLNPDEEENMEAVMAAAANAGLQWSDLSDEEKKSLYRDYTGEELSINKIEDLANSTSGGTQAGRLFVADNAAEKLGQLGTMYMGKRAKDKLSKQKAQAYELAGGLAAGQAAKDAQYSREIADILRGKNPVTEAVTTESATTMGSVPGSTPQPAPQSGPRPPLANPGGAPDPQAPAMPPGAGGGGMPPPGPNNPFARGAGNNPDAGPPVPRPGQLNPGVPAGQGPLINPLAGGDKMDSFLEKMKYDEWIKKLGRG